MCVLLDRRRTSLAGIDHTLGHRLAACKSFCLDIVDFCCADYSGNTAQLRDDAALLQKSYLGSTDERERTPA
jgi:hypothetical protein